MFYCGLFGMSSATAVRVVQTNFASFPLTRFQVMWFPRTPNAQAVGRTRLIRDHRNRAVFLSPAELSFWRAKNSTERKEKGVKILLKHLLERARQYVPRCCCCRRRCGGGCGVYRGNTRWERCHWATLQCLLRRVTGEHLFKKTK